VPTQQRDGEILGPTPEPTVRTANADK